MEKSRKKIGEKCNGMEMENEIVIGFGNIGRIIIIIILV